MTLPHLNPALGLFYPFLITITLALLIPLAMMGISAILGPTKKSKVKMEPYECGVPPAPQGRGNRLSVKFFMVALLFLVFDIEIVFLYPWAVAFRSLGVLGFVEMVLFVVVLLVGLVYAWKRGALLWE